MPPNAKDYNELWAAQTCHIGDMENFKIPILHFKTHNHVVTYVEQPYLEKNH